MTALILGIVIVLILWAVLGFYLCFNAGKDIGKHQGYIEACKEIKKILRGEQP